MDIDEVQYLSENELISVVPNFKHPEIHLIRGTVGPFLPLIPLKVPMWMVCFSLQRILFNMKFFHRRFILKKVIVVDSYVRNG